MSYFCFLSKVEQNGLCVEPDDEGGLLRMEWVLSGGRSDMEDEEWV